MIIIINKLPPEFIIWNAVKILYRLIINLEYMSLYELIKFGPFYDVFNNKIKKKILCFKT